MQEIILNTRCINHSFQGKGDPKRRVPWCSLPEPRVKVTKLLDPSPIPDPCLTVSQEEGAPDNNYLHFYIVHEAPDDIHR